MAPHGYQTWRESQPRLFAPQHHYPPKETRLLEGTPRPQAHRTFQALLALQIEHRCHHHANFSLLAKQMLWHILQGIRDTLSLHIGPLDLGRSMSVLFVEH